MAFITPNWAQRPRNFDFLVRFFLRQIVRYFRVSIQGENKFMMQTNWKIKFGVLGVSKIVPFDSFRASGIVKMSGFENPKSPNLIRARKK